jgi:hypothetical protein
VRVDFHLPCPGNIYNDSLLRERENELLVICSENERGVSRYLLRERVVICSENESLCEERRKKK